MYINTVQSETKIEPAQEFKEVLPLVVLESECVDVEIIGLDSIQSYLACCKCGKKIEYTDQHRFVECLHCHFKQKKAAAATHWFARVLVDNKTSNQPSRFDLTFFESSIKQLAEERSRTQCVPAFTKEVIEDLFFATSLVSLTYNKRTHVVENVNAAHYISTLSSLNLK